MKRAVLALLAAFTIAFGVAPALPAVAATDPFGKISCSNTGGGGSTVCQSKGQTDNPIAGPDGILIKATNIVAFIAGIAAVIFLILSGLKYVTSNGDAAEVAKAKQSIIYALVGIAVIAIARSLINFVIGRL